jgi:hypothetical protein
MELDGTKALVRELSNALKLLRMSDVAAELDKHFEESHHNAP